MLADAVTHVHLQAFGIVAMVGTPGGAGSPRRLSRPTLQGLQVEFHGNGLFNKLLHRQLTPGPQAMSRQCSTSLRPQCSRYLHVCFCNSTVSALQSHSCRSRMCILHTLCPLDIAVSTKADLDAIHAGDENTPPPRPAVPKTVLQVLQPLIQACCSARGKRPHCNAAGELLACAIESLSSAGDASPDANLAVLQQVANLMVQGTMPCDNVGSFRALRAGWSQLHKGVAADMRMANSTIIVVMRALNANRHWTVRRKNLPVSIPLVTKTPRQCIS